MNRNGKKDRNGMLRWKRAVLLLSICLIAGITAGSAENAVPAVRNQAYTNLEDALMITDGGLTGYTGPATASLVIPEGVTEIADYALSGLETLNQVTLPSTLRIIGESAFEGASLDDVKLPEGLETIGENAFNDAFTSVGFGTGTENACIYVPASVTEIGDNAFGSLRGVRAVCDSYAAHWATEQDTWWDLIHPERVIIYDVIWDGSRVTAREECSREDCAEPFSQPLETADVLEYFVRPTETTAGYFERKADFQTEGLAYTEVRIDMKPLGESDVLRIPEDTVIIEAGAFEGVDCEALILPENCEEVGERAFANCDNLCYVYAPAGCSLDPTAFTGSDNVFLDRGDQ